MIGEFRTSITDGAFQHVEKPIEPERLNRLTQILRRDLVAIMMLYYPDFTAKYIDPNDKSKLDIVLREFAQQLIKNKVSPSNLHYGLTRLKDDKPTINFAPDPATFAQVMCQPKPEDIDAPSYHDCRSEIIKSRGAMRGQGYKLRHPITQHLDRECGFDMHAATSTRQEPRFKEAYHRIFQRFIVGKIEEIKPVAAQIEDKSETPDIDNEDWLNHRNPLFRRVGELRALAQKKANKA